VTGTVTKLRLHLPH